MDSLRVLLVEDDLADQRMVRRATRDSKPKVSLTCVDRLQPALERLSTDVFDAVLLDLSLPDSDPANTFPTVREHAIDTPIVVLTGNGDERSAIRAVHQGAQDYLIKGSVPLEPMLGRALKYAIARQKAEIALRASDQRFRHLVENAPDMVLRYRLHPERKLEFINRAVRDGLGYTLEELDEQLNNGLHLVHEDDRETVQRLLTGEMAGRRTVRLISKSGDVFWVDANVAPVTDQRQRITAVQAIARDVTEQKQAQEELASTQRQLLEAQKMEAVGRLAGGVAHDFNNLLTVIFTFGEFAAEQLENEHPARGDLGEVLRAAKRAEKLVSQLLAFSRKKTVSPVVMNANDSLRSTHRLLERILGEDIQLDTHLASDLWSTKIDAGAFEQVVMNLAVNARDAMPVGGRLSIETDNVELGDGYVAARGAEIPAGEYVRITVSDSGEGMDDETQQHIFEPFFTTKAVGQGTGLGLATCFGIVRQAGGYIWVYSEPGRGTAFKLYLPRCPDEQQPATVLSPSTAKGGNETILVVEDDEQVRAVVARSLERVGYRVLSARNGPQALKLLEEFGEDDEVHLLLTDVVMPQMTGKRLAEQVARRRPGLKVAYMSGYTEDTITHHGVLEKGLTLLQKPLAPRELTSKVRQLLDAEGSFIPPPKPRLLLVEDDVDVRNALERELADEYEVRAVETGVQALELLEKQNFEAILCDLVMPGGLSGRELHSLVRHDQPELAERFVFMTGDSGLLESLQQETGRPVVEKAAGAVAIGDSLRPIAVGQQAKSPG